MLMTVQPVSMQAAWTRLTKTGFHNLHATVIIKQPVWNFNNNYIKAGADSPVGGHYGH